jgi:hypothetical protein
MLGQAASANEVAAAVRVAVRVAAGEAVAAVRDAVAAEEAASANEVAVPALVAARVAATAVTDVGRVAAVFSALAAVRVAAEEYDNTVQTGVFLRLIEEMQQQQ